MEIENCHFLCFVVVDIVVAAGSVLLFDNKTKFAGSAAWLCISVMDFSYQWKKTLFRFTNNYHRKSCFRST